MSKTTPLLEVPRHDLVQILYDLRTAIVRMGQLGLDPSVARRFEDVSDQIEGYLGSGQDMDSIPTCICNEWDKRGWSTCGGRCELHPPDYHCPCSGCTHHHGACQCSVAQGRRCLHCSKSPEED